ncbi:transketolase [Thomasclavelia ramosa]|jgi:transketolase|uniref:transketolase n=1 Tax=Thomasclavelia ramosa TaxID=1547 RepID=UPI000E42CE18|nr:transketolase [Thomasclavelia ramosa]RGC87439.1 transketolase [Thomasclavelia ramosa]
MEAVDRKTVSTIRALCADTVEKANSGHPGLPLGSAAAAYILWGKVMKHSGTHRKWVNRDRFILSGGHGSSLLYSLLHLYNYGLTIEDLRQFRQLDSLTPGHPEYGHTVGVEATTGPLGAGMAMATGMAMAQAHLAAIFNRPGYPVFDNFTYVLGGDGCLMEGISSEAFSLAGTLKLEKLIVLYDSNNISIEGSTDIAFREDVQGRMKAFGFDTFTVEDGDDLDEILSAINQARVSQKPAFIEVKTRIGKGCPAKEGKASAHGEPLGEENVRELKRTLGLDEDRTFAIDEEVYLNTAKQQERSEVIYKIWKDMFDDYLVTYPEMKKLWKQYFEVDYNKVLENDVEFWKFENKPESTRNLSGTAMNRIKELFPNFMGGSADLAPSTKTYLNKVGDFSAENYRGRNLHYGVREQAMTGIGNGIMLYGGLKTFVSTFFVFSDYVKPMARLSALMNLPLIYVLTHDSIGVGEDGPTHEPVEQLTMLRAMPNFNVFRPCDAQETNAGWYLAMTSKTTPTALVLSRQNLPQIKGSSREALKGGYVIDECEGTPEIIIIASGSEVTLAVEAKKRIRGKAIRVVSMPSMDIFKQQSREYRESILPPGIEKRIAIEAGSRMSWGEFVGLKGKYITMDSFGASAPADELFKRYGFTVDNVVKMINKL